ncbi:AAA family ATPase [Bacillus alkalicellulosilyticus]|uniref:AAA family ATPase n=1 Tax=Alkalihalobacterium alkalicellulosilyticum TaxID=1912214 RepID=UPI0009973565|nr:AAA family ATPase [Bacillus alkalicellulosilyticus]
MKKISLLIMDKDSDYIESVAHYLRNSEFASKFEVKLFTQQSSLDQFLQTGARVHILLGSTQMLPESFDATVDVVIGLEESMYADERDFPIIFKYQPLAQLFSKVLSIYYERHGKAPKKILTGEENTEIISVYSASGGTGKTTSALHVAKALADQEYRVFYLNLELINSTALFFAGEEDNVSAPILYYLKTSTEQLPMKIEALKKYDDDLGVDVFRMLPSAEEMLDLTREQTELLLQTLYDSGNYDYIIVDLDMGISPCVLATLAKSYHVLWLVNYDVQSFYKTGSLLEELHSILQDGDFREKVSIVLNRYMGSIPDEFADFDLDIEAYLPYVPEWKEIKDVNQLLSTPIFAEYIQKMIQTLIEKSRGVEYAN